MHDDTVGGWWLIPTIGLPTHLPIRRGWGGVSLVLADRTVVADAAVQFIAGVLTAVTGRLASCSVACVGGGRLLLLLVVVVVGCSRTS